MTRKEAIEWFKENPFYHKNHESFNMAIKALEQEPISKKILKNANCYKLENIQDNNPCIDCSEKTWWCGEFICKEAREYLDTNSTTKNDLAIDCISRQATINAVKRIHPVDTDYDCTLYDKVDVMYVLDEMPSVTPQLSSGLAKKSKKLEKNFGELDCISRADARSLICNTDIKHHMSGMSRKVFKDLYNGMDELPPVTPQESKTGHWMKNNIGGAKVCSVCNAHMGLSSFKYCPNCGAKMKSEDNNERP